MEGSEMSEFKVTAKARRARRRRNKKRELKVLPLESHSGFQMHNLLTGLLEEKCYSFGVGSVMAQTVFKELCKHLRFLRVLPPLSVHNLYETKDLRSQYVETVDMLILRMITRLRQTPPALTQHASGDSVSLNGLSLTEKDAPVLPASHYESQFQELGLLGKGGYGSVYKARNKLDDTEYAIKKIIFKHIMTLETDGDLLREVKTLANLRHENIVGYYGAWMEFDRPEVVTTASSSLESSETYEDQSSTSARTSEDHSPQLPSPLLVKHSVLYIQTELCNNTLQNWLVERNTKFAENNDNISMYKNNIKIFHQVLLGVEFIHAKGRMHRDLTPRNIFLSGSDLQVKIGDFGLAKDLFQARNECLMLTASSGATTEVCSKHTEGLGTSTYASPEQLKGSEYDIKSDMYSLGVILYEMFHVFNTEMEKYHVIKMLRNRRRCSEEFRKKWPKIVVDTVETLTDLVPGRRPVASDILKGPLISTGEQQTRSAKERKLQLQVKGLRGALGKRDKQIKYQESVIASLRSLIFTQRRENSV